MTDTGSPPNILFIIWDACRTDYIKRNAPTLESLAEENIVFENAITPASWSLPSHASLFTGQYPHEHDIYRVNDSLREITLFDELRERDYRCYGASGNGFVSHSNDLHVHFDSLQYTSGQGPFLDGLTIYSHVFGSQEDLSPPEAMIDTVRSTLTHDHPIKSLINFGAVGLNRVAANVPPLQRIPHTIFNPFQPYSYSPKRNTTVLRSAFQREADRDGPFFAFANYMDTHRPYAPPPEYQREQLGEVLSYKQITDINDNITDPWKFVKLAESGAINESDLQTVRSLYAGEVQSIDNHLEQVLNELKTRGLRENTLIVVTADHGENLGETDAMGRQRMGHHASMSDNLLRVPLVIAHPDLSPQRVKEFVSLKNLYHLFTGGYERLLSSGGADLGPLLSRDGVVVSEYPADGASDLYDQYPDVPREAIAQRVEEHATAVYGGEWRVVADSTGQTWAWEEGQEREFTDAPERIRETCESHLSALIQRDAEGTDVELSDEQITQLESLGYL